MGIVAVTVLMAVFPVSRWVACWVGGGDPNLAGQLGDSFGGHANVVLGLINLAVLCKIYFSQKTDSRTEIALARETACVDRLMEMASIAVTAEELVARDTRLLGDYRAEFDFMAHTALARPKPAMAASDSAEPNESHAPGSLRLATLEDLIKDTRASLSAVSTLHDELATLADELINKASPDEKDRERLRSLYAVKRRAVRQEVDEERSALGRDTVSAVLGRLLELAQIASPIFKSIESSADRLTRFNAQADEIVRERANAKDPLLIRNSCDEERELRSKAAQEQRTIDVLSPKLQAFTRACDATLAMAAAQSPEAVGWLKEMYQAKLRG
jgi:hypothetical protein